MRIVRFCGAPTGHLRESSMSGQTLPAGSRRRQVHRQDVLSSSLPWTLQGTSTTKSLRANTRSVADADFLSGAEKGEGITLGLVTQCWITPIDLFLSRRRSGALRIVDTP